GNLEFRPDDNQRTLLPIRPIVFGGDDTTFVCDGRIGVALAVEYLRAFEHEAREDSQLKTLLAQLKILEGLTACAGVAIVKSHYPFARAYALSEDLCSEAKKFRRRVGLQGGALDWYFSTSGLYADLGDMRAREYHVPSGSLTLRPVATSKEDKEKVHAHHWSVIEWLTKKFQSGDWSEKRNKAKLLRDALRQGPQAVSRFREVYVGRDKYGTEEDLPPFYGFENGWCEGLCGYFDALELMDIHISLQSQDQKSTGQGDSES
ncbi:MAG: hypothetical protein RML95_13710, partial [Anaerolineae bacterium]|nr:hypothetical protein [Anaerolineae bacterium]